MKLLSLLLSSLSISVGAKENSDRVLKIEDVPSLVKTHLPKLMKLRSTEANEEFSPIANSFLRSHTLDECTEQDTAFYTETAISDAELFTFIGGGAYNNPSFDMEAFFDSLNFDAECASLGGNVISVGLEFSMEGFSIELADYKLCMPTVCNKFEYMLTKNTFLYIVGMFTGMNMELKSDDVTSFMCLMSQGVLYNNTAISDFSPESFFIGGGLEYLESSSKCRSFNNYADLKVCNVEEFREEVQMISTYCDSQGGDVYPLDFIMNAPFYHRTVRRFPLCKASTCSESDITNYYEYITSYASGEHYYGEITTGGSMSIIKSLVNSCDETATNKAFIKKNKGKVLSKTCKWMRKRSEALKEKYCSKTSGVGSVGPASFVCPATCCTCTEGNYDLFLKKASFSVAGELNVEAKTCDWLKGITEKARKFQCGKSAASYILGLPPAYIACPQTCGSCSA